MAKSKKEIAGVCKKTKSGCSRNTKYSHKGGGVNGSTISKNYKKKYRGQGN